MLAEGVEVYSIFQAHHESRQPVVLRIKRASAVRLATLPINRRGPLVQAMQIQRRLLSLVCCVPLDSCGVQRHELSSYEAEYSVSWSIDA